MINSSIDMVYNLHLAD